MHPPLTRADVFVGFTLLRMHATDAHHGASLRALKTFEGTVALSRLRTVWRIIRALFWI
jgi:hypothetical protein